MTVWHLREQAAAGERALFFFSRLGSGASLLGDTQYAFQVLMVRYLKSANEVNRGYASVLT